MSRHGFVVAMRSPVADELHPSYAGLDRLPPWTLEVADALAVDELGALEDEFGLLPSLRVAEQALNIYSRVWPRSELEVLWADACSTLHDHPALIDAELGYDVATDAPFYSIVHEMPAPPAELGSFRAQLNDSRLFRARSQAELYLEAYRAEYRRNPTMEDPEAQRIWQVFRTRL